MQRFDFSRKGPEMANVKILTDNVAQIPPEIAKKHLVDIIHFTIIIEGKSYKDGIDIFPSDIYQQMRTEEISPKTSQPALGEYLNFFKTHLENGYQNLLYLTLPKDLSGAYSTATTAAHLVEQEFPGRRIAVIDARTTTIAQGFLALSAARAAQEGANIEQLTRLIEEERSKVGFLAMLETLKYLQRGGRIGKAAYLVGNMINIKPIITIDKDGNVAPLGNIRGEKKCLIKLVDCMASQLNGRIPSRGAVMHADDLEKAEQLKQLTQECFGLKDILITDFTPVMGAHAGPGVLGLGYQLK
jgi:DegV family protein with EDD domain